jgi:histidinol phosphatase-like enzyme
MKQFLFRSKEKKEEDERKLMEKKVMLKLAKAMQKELNSREWRLESLYGCPHEPYCGCDRD